MQVNETIYPDVDVSTNRVYTKNINEYPLNTRLDETIVYSSSTSRYANKSAKLIVNRKNSSGGAVIDPIVLNLYKNDFARNLLLVPDTVYRSDVAGNGMFYDGRFGYDAENYPVIGTNNLYKTKLLKAFKYYAEIACIYVVYQTSTNPIQTSTATLKDYYASHSNERIISVYVKIFSGSETTRNSTTLYASHYDDRSTILFNDDAGTDFSQQNTLYYLPDSFYRTASTTEAGYLLIGLNVERLYYYTNQIAGKRAGSVFFNSDYVSWDNLTNISNDNIPCFFPEFTLSKNEILSMAACLGVLFTDNETTAKTLDLSKDENIGDDDLYFPIQDDQGLWQGEFTHGAGNYETDQYKNNWNSDVNAPFNNGSPSVDDINNSIYSDGETLGLITPAAAFTNMYLISAANLKNLVDWLNPADDDIFEGRLDGLKFSGANPLNSITNIMQFPVNVPHSGTAENVVIGKLTSPVLANKITTSTFEISGGTTKPIYAFYNNWLDYEPYTQYVAWIPYCGWIELSANVITGKSVSFKYEIDIISGACTCRILVDGVQYKTINGNIATQFAIQAEDTKSYTQSVMNSVGKIGAGFAGVFAGAAVTETGVGAVAGIPLMLGSFGNAVSGFWDFVCPQENFTTVGTMTGNVSCFCPRKVNIYRFYTPVKPDVNYGNYVGYACEFSETLSNLSGFCMVSNADTNGIVATDAELKEIISILESGFYI